MSIGAMIGGMAPMASMQVPGQQMAPGVQIAAPPPDRVSRWKQFLVQAQQDPNLRMAILQTGLGLMQSPQVGQSGWDVAGQALGRGVQTLHSLREQDRRQKTEEEDRAFKKEQVLGEAGREERKVAKEEQTGGAYTKSLEGQAAIAEAKARHEEAAFSETMAPGAVERRRKLEEAQIAEKRASAGRDVAAAELAGRTDPNVRAESTGGAAGMQMRALSDELQAGGMDKVKADAEAARQVMKNQAASSKLYARTGAVQKMAEQMFPYTEQLTPEQMQQADAAVTTIEQSGQRQKEQQLNDQYIGRDIEVIYKGIPQNAKVQGITNGQVTVLMPNGDMITRPAAAFNLGEQNAR